MTRVHAQGLRLKNYPPPDVPNLGTGWSWEVKFTLRPSFEPMARWAVLHHDISKINAIVYSL